MHNRIVPLGIALALCSLAGPAAGQQAGEWTLSAGVHQVNPKSDNGQLVGGTLDVSIGSNVRPTIAAEYFIRDNLGIEVLGACGRCQALCRAGVQLHDVHERGHSPRPCQQHPQAR